jgi:hypothetical protein
MKMLFEYLKGKSMVLFVKMMFAGLQPTQKLTDYFKERMVRHAKSLRLSWLGHVECMESERTLKCLLNGELFGVHRRGRPRKRWFQDVKDDLQRMRNMVNGKRRHRNKIHGG